MLLKKDRMNDGIAMKKIIWGLAFMITLDYNYIWNGKNAYQIKRAVCESDGKYSHLR